jgi:hypothetical protein
MSRLFDLVSVFVMCTLSCTLIFITYMVIERQEEPRNYNTESVLLVIEGLRKAHPNASEICIVVAANIAVNNYEDVQHLMEAHGRCATKLIGLRVTKENL